MRGSWEIAVLAGISVRIHWTFLILPLVVGWSAWAAAGPEAAAGAVVFVAAIFACVVLHELGHALAARRFGIGTRDITLLPIGGVARLERMPRQPLQELVIALAGPAVNVLIAAALFAAFLLYGSTAAQVLQSDALRGPFAIRLMWMNVVLVMFNLLPAFPMDGGRVLRSLLALRLSHSRATEIAAGVGQAMAVVFAVLGLYTISLTLVLVAAFVFLAARSELMLARLQAATGDWAVGDLMQSQFQTVPAQVSLAELAPRLVYSEQRDFPVVHAQRLVGMLRASDLLAALADGRGERQVADVMQRGVPTVDRRDPLVETLVTLQSNRVSSLPVAEGGLLVGLLSGDRLRQWLQSITTNTPGRAPGVLREGG